MDDLIGIKYNYLTVLKKVTPDKYKHKRYLCKCICGKTKVVLKLNLSNGRTKSCGCYRKNEVSKRTRKDLVGKVFGKLKVIKQYSVSKRREIIWECLCECGVIKHVKSVYLLNGDVCSCGCLKKELVGDKHHNWKGGISKLPYCPDWTSSYKKEIKDRDGNICQNPYCYKTTDKLCVHHVDYTKTICGPDNLITICIGCNSRANTDREWHTEWYRLILNKKYGYTYD